MLTWIKSILSNVVLAELWRHLSPLDQADLFSAAGKTAGNFLDPSPVPGDEFVMPDHHIRCALRRRLRLPCPGFSRALHGGSSSTHCQHKSHDSGNFCGCELDPFGRHAGQCHISGLVDRWHDTIRDWLLRWVEKHTTMPVAEEPYVSQWNYWERNPSTGVAECVEARLDGGFHFHKGGQGYFDVTIPNAATTNAEDLRERAHKPGAAAQNAVRGKFRKYPPDKHPAATLVPFAIEALGCPSGEALQLLRDLAPSDPKERAAALKEAHYRLSTLVAMRQAELLMAAEGAAVFGSAPRKLQLPTQQPSHRPQHNGTRVAMDPRAWDDSDYFDTTRSSLQVGSPRIQ